MTMRKTKQLSENQKSIGGFIKFGVVLIIIGVVLYSEIMFLGIISVIFPQGVLRLGAIVGAVATGMSVLALYAGKSHWFTPGSQLLAAWIFTGVEIAILVMNDILAYSLHNGHVDGYLALWQSVTPASPVVALVGWGVILFLDRAQQERHKDMEMEAQKADKEREYTIAAHDAEMSLRSSHLAQVTAQLENVMASDAVQRQIAEHAQRMVARVLTDVSGLNALSHSSAPALPRIVESEKPVSLAKTSTQSAVEEETKK